MGLLAVFFMGTQRLQLNEDIYAIFPENGQFQQFNETLKERHLNSKIVFSVNAEDQDLYDLMDQMDSLGIAIDELLGDDIAELKVFREDVQSEVIQRYYSVYPSLLNEKDYQSIAERLNVDSINQSMENAHQRLTSAQGFVFRDLISKDPLGLAWNGLRDLNPSSDSSAIQLEDGVLLTRDRNSALFTARLNFDLNDNKRAEKFNETLIAFKEELAKKQPSLGFDYFGTFQIAYANSVQVKKDTSITVWIGAGLIILIIMLYFRSILTPLLFVLPAVFSAICGLGLVGYVQPDISMISIATSAVLMGIVLDYSFHFFTHYGETGSLIETVKSISAPMLVGSFTTVAAFAALIFTDSVILQDFGVIALCILFSAAVFTLLFLPTILHLIRYRGRHLSETTKQQKKLPKLVFRLSFIAIIAGTVFFLYQRSGVSFDSDLNNLSFHETDLQQKEAYLTGINPAKQKKIYMFSEGKTKDEALSINFELYQTLKSEKEEGRIQEVLTVAPYCLPASKLEEGTSQWKNFWEGKAELLKTRIAESGTKYDFTEEAFNPFFEWIQPSDNPTSIDEEIAGELGFNDLLYEKDDGWVAVTSCVIDKMYLEGVKKTARQVDGVFVFDVSEMTNALIGAVQADFNYLLLFSSIIVFLTLLIIYGRIELALFSFFPMLVSWIWILGFAAIFDIQFNFVNIIITTFIFGLGDDFSIFVTDGLLKKFKTGINTIASYRTAILLSGITTVIGTGVLYFAKHPAIHSIAAISVIGILCIIVVTLLVQPIIFNFFVQRRVDKGRSPVTFGVLLYSLFLFTYFLVGCVVLNVLLLLMMLVPMNSLKKRNFLNFLISKMTKSTLYAGIHVKKRIIGEEKLNYDKPSIIVANHSSFLDILLVLMLHPKTVIMVKKWVYNSPFFGPFIRYSGYLFMEEGPGANTEVMKQRIEEGYSIVIFPEGTRSKTGKLGRFHKGAFFLAKELGLDVQPILITGAHEVNPKNDFLIKKGTLMITVMDRVTADDPIFEERYGKIARSFSDRMRAKQTEVADEYVNSKWITNRLMYNYIFKGPIVEWYVRTKWSMERKNFEFYDQLIGDRSRIYDIGCGYGYLSYYLHYRNDSRVITGIDYDEDKIDLAAGCSDKSELLTFESKDARHTELESSDVIIYTDVLHYLQEEEQLQVMETAVDSLNPNGILLIRDGITDLNERHEMTQKTERFSTKYFGFNKVTNELSFFSSKMIEEFAQRKGLTFKMVEQSEKTSNVLFILQKQEG